MRAWSHREQVFTTRFRLREGSTPSVKGETVDAWYSGEHHEFGVNFRAIMCPDGLPVWTSDLMPGHLHDTICPRELDTICPRRIGEVVAAVPSLTHFRYKYLPQTR